MAVLWVSDKPGAMEFLLILLSIFCTGSCSGQVPLVLWSSEGYPLPQQNPPPAGHIVSTGQLDSYLSSALSTAPQNTLVFLQDQLSVDDFTVYGGVFDNKQDSAFPHLESALQASSSPLVLPALSWEGSSSVLPLLQKHLGTPPLYLDPSSLEQLSLNASVAALLVIRLPYSPGSDPMSPKEALRGNDAVIGQVLDIMKTQDVPYTAIYTALKPSREAQEMSMGVQSVGRTLLQTPSSSYAPVRYPNDSACILMWAENLSVFQERDQKWTRFELGPMTFGAGATVTFDGSSCNTTRSRLVLNYQNILGYQTFRLIFSMSRSFYKVSARDWFTLDHVELEYDTQRLVFNGSRNIYAPAEYSYRCESVTSYLYALLVPSDPKDPLSSQWRLSFEDFQIQGFSVSGNNFAYASDCASFFTPAIWMGLLTSLLMLLILTYGLHMITQLRTMDRFDDPKGPSISVPQNE